MSYHYWLRVWFMIRLHVPNLILRQCFIDLLQNCYARSRFCLVFHSFYVSRVYNSNIIFTCLELWFFIVINLFPFLWVKILKLHVLACKYFRSRIILLIKFWFIYRSSLLKNLKESYFFALFTTPFFCMVFYIKT